MVAVTGRMLAVFAPQVLCYGLAVVLYGILQAHRQFTAPALAPVLSSLVVIAAYLLFVPFAAGHRRQVAGLPVSAELILSVGTTLGVAALALTALIPALAAAAAAAAHAAVPGRRRPPGPGPGRLRDLGADRPGRRAAGGDPAGQRQRHPGRGGAVQLRLAGLRVDLRRARHPDRHQRVPGPVGQRRHRVRRDRRRVQPGRAADVVPGRRAAGRGRRPGRPRVRRSRPGAGTGPGLRRVRARPDRLRAHRLPVAGAAGLGPQRHPRRGHGRRLAAGDRRRHRARAPGLAPLGRGRPRPGQHGRLDDRGRRPGTRGPPGPGPRGPARDGQGHPRRAGGRARRGGRRRRRRRARDPGRHSPPLVLDGVAAALAAACAVAVFGGVAYVLDGGELRAALGRVRRAATR